MSACSHEHHNALHGVHDHHNVEQRLAEAESLCSATGARLTPLRKEVLELILNATGPMGAYDLLAKIKSESDRPAAPPTVYRTLDFLLEKGLIHRLTSINAYVISILIYLDLFILIAFYFIINFIVFYLILFCLDRLHYNPSRFKFIEIL